MVGVVASSDEVAVAAEIKVCSTVLVGLVAECWMAASWAHLSASLCLEKLTTISVEVKKEILVPKEIWQSTKAKKVFEKPVYPLPQGN